MAAGQPVTSNLRLAPWTVAANNGKWRSARKPQRGWKQSTAKARKKSLTPGKDISMSLTKLKDFLDANQVKYVAISHSVAYTAQGIAALVHIPGKELAKTVVVRIDRDLAMAVVPASYHVDLALLKKAAGASTAQLATEEEFKDRFPDCETGAMPPFGNLYGMTVFADEGLAQDHEIAFNAGSHRELVRMAWLDFERLVKPRMMKLAAGKHVSAA